MQAATLLSPPRPSSAVSMAAGVALLLIVSYAAAQVSPILAGIIYAIGFLSLTWSKPAVALAMIFAMAPAQQDISGEGSPVRFSIAEINLLLSLPLLIWTTRPRRSRVTAWGFWACVTLYFIFSLLSCVRQWRPSATVSIVQMVIYLVIAVRVFAALPKRPEDYLMSLISILLVCTLLAVGTLMHGEFVFGMHKNGIGASLATGVIIGVELWVSASHAVSKRFIAITTIASIVGLTLSLSRGSWVAAAVGVLSILALRRQFRLLSRVGLALVPAVMVAWMLLPAEKKEYALSFDTTRVNINARLASIATAREYFESSPVIGAGIWLRKDFDATNIFWVTLAETGVLGLIAFTGIHVSLAAMVLPLRRRMKMGDPRLSFAILGVALTYGHLAHGMFDHYWSRGAIMAAWASVGMLLRVHRDVYSESGRR